MPCFSPCFFLLARSLAHRFYTPTPTPTRRPHSRLFRVYAHLYLVHLPHMEARGALQHLSSCYKHLLFVALEFSLIDDRELAPLQPLIRGILAEDARRTAFEASQQAQSSPPPRRLGGQRPAPSPSAQARLQRSQSSGGGGAGLLRPARAFSSPSSSPAKGVPSSEEGGGEQLQRRAQSQQLGKQAGAGAAKAGGNSGRPSRSYSDLERRGGRER